MSTFEPVRLYLYGLLVPLLGVLIYFGVVTSDSVPLWIALATGVLGVGATEAARSEVTPVATLPYVYDEGDDYLFDDDLP